MNKKLPKLPIIVLLSLAVAAIGWQATPVFSAFTPYKIQNTTKAVSLATTQAPIVDVRRFGAKVDGVTNDAAAVQAAIDYATSLSTGASVWIPRGICFLASSIEMKSNVRLFGDGSGSVLKRGWNSGSANGVIQVTGARSNCTIENLLIEGNSGTYSTTSNNGIYGLTGGYSNIQMNRLVIQNCAGASVIFLAAVGAHGSNVSLTNSSILHSGAHGVVFQDYVDNASIIGNYVYRTSLLYADRPGITMGRYAVNQVCSENVVDLNNEALGSSSHGISIDTCSYVVCNNNIVRRLGSANPSYGGYGIEVGFVSFGTFVGNTVDTNSPRGGIVLSGNSANGGKNTDCVISGNTITNSRSDKSTAGGGIYAFVATPDGTTLHERITVASNNVTGCKTGVQLENCRDLTVSGNTVTSCYWSGIYTYQTDRAKVFNNLVYTCNTANSASHAGVRVLLASALQDVEVANNRSTNSGNSGISGYEDLFITVDGSNGTPPITVVAPYDFNPYITGVSNLGSSSKRWNLYATALNSSGATTLSGAVTSTGGFTISTNDVTSPMVLNPVFSDPTATNLGLSSTFVLSAGATQATAAQRALNIVARADGTGGANGSTAMTGVNGEAQSNQTAGTWSGILSGVAGTARAINAGAVTTAAGVSGSIILSSTGNVTSGYGVRAVTPTASSSGVLTTAAGLYAQNQSLSGSTNSYGLLVDAQTQSGGATNVFAALFNGGQVKIESGATGTTALLLNTPASPTARVFQVNVNGTFKAGVNPSGALRGQGLQLDPVSAALTGNTTLSSSSQQVQICDTTSAGFTLTLPLAASAGNGLIFTVVNIGSANTLTVGRSGGEAFITNGSLTGTTVSLTSGQCATFIASTLTSKWIMVSKNF